LIQSFFIDFRNLSEQLRRTCGDQKSLLSSTRAARRMPPGNQAGGAKIREVSK